MDSKPLLIIESSVLRKLDSANRRDCGIGMKGGDCGGRMKLLEINARVGVKEQYEVIY